MDVAAVSFINYLESFPSITDLVGDRIWGDDYLVTAIDNMPEKAIVVGSAGGRPLGISATSYIQVGGERFDVKSYGETLYDARLVDLAVWNVLRNLAKGPGIGWARPEGGPLPLREPKGDFPYILSVYYVLTGEK